MVMICGIAFGAAFVSVSEVSAQGRLQRPPSRKYEGGPVVVARSQTLPPGAVLVFEMDSVLSSKTAVRGDRFRGRLITPVIDEYGKTLLGPGTCVEGHVTDVEPARRPRRSGVISIKFDRLRLKNGRVLALRGVLTSPNPRDHRDIDEDRENEIRPSNTGRDVAFIGGGAGAGVGIGLIAGSALAGAGIGAAAGVTGLLLTKGKEAVVQPGHRFGVQLSQRLNLRPPRPAWPPFPDGTVPSDLVDVSYVRAERGYDGSLRIFITAETPSTGWRIYTNHRIFGDTVEVFLRGASDGGFNRVSRPAADPIVIPDRDRFLKRVIVRARNGSREVLVEQLSYSGGPASTVPAVVVEPAGPVGSGLGARLAAEVEGLRRDVAATIGVGLNPYDTGLRRPNVDERRLLDGLGSLLNSVQSYNASTTAGGRQNSALRIQEDARAVERSWVRVRLNPDLNQRFRIMFRDVRALTGLGPSPDYTTGPVGPPQPYSTRPRAPEPSVDYPTLPPNSPAYLPGTPSPGPAPDANRVVGQIQRTQFDFGASVGAWIEPDGSYQVLGPRQPTADERQLLTGLTTLLNSVKDLNRAPDPSARRQAAARVQDAARVVEQYSGRVRLTPDLSQKFRTMLQDSRALAAAA
ncbi:MAG TPA: hypothetical protein VJ302_08865 [Blastocatellia bacterium]|nr:hypothetical protein [Blastocatellia bacterium]